MSTDSEISGFSRSRPLMQRPDLASRVADLLRTPHALLQLTPDEATAVATQMTLVGFAQGGVLLRERDGYDADHLLLLLEGEVSVETDPDCSGPVAVSVVGPGSVIGEMSLLDGAPRSASCVAMTAVQAASLSRRGLEALLDAHPRAAAKLLLGLAVRMADRLRALGDQLQIYSQIVADKQAELDRLLGGRRQP